jgi:hypothetical protein
VALQGGYGLVLPAAVFFRGDLRGEGSTDLSALTCFFVTVLFDVLGVVSLTCLVFVPFFAMLLSLLVGFLLDKTFFPCTSPSFGVVGLESNCGVIILLRVIAQCLSPLVSFLCWHLFSYN